MHCTAATLAEFMQLNTVVYTGTIPEYMQLNTVVYTGTVPEYMKSNVLYTCGYINLIRVTLVKVKSNILYTCTIPEYIKSNTVYTGSLPEYKQFISRFLCSLTNT